MTSDSNRENFARMIMADMQTMRSEAVFRVVIKWANKGRHGTENQVVIADDAIEAIQLAWNPEDPRDIRSVSCEWLSPIDCVVKKSESKDEPDNDNASVA